MVELAKITVEVVHALPDRAFGATVELSAGATVADAIRLSGLVESNPKAEAVPLVAGIFGRRVPLSAQPQDGDRIEIYRSLVADPKQLRVTRIRSAAKAGR